jgi:hypothetical protein
MRLEHLADGQIGDGLPQTVVEQPGRATVGKGAVVTNEPAVLHDDITSICRNACVVNARISARIACVTFDVARHRGSGRDLAARRGGSGE